MTYFVIESLLYLSIPLFIFSMILAYIIDKHIREEIEYRKYRKVGLI